MNEFPTPLDAAGRLTVTRADDIVIIARQLMHAQRLDGTNIVVLGGDDVLDDLRQWAREEPVASIQRALGCGWGTASRLRRALGLATVYTRQSATTRWRRKARAAAEE